jgi:hypothetical protein
MKKTNPRRVFMVVTAVLLLAAGGSLWAGKYWSNGFSHHAKTATTAIPNGETGITIVGQEQPEQNGDGQTESKQTGREQQRGKQPGSEQSEQKSGQNATSQTTGTKPADTQPNPQPQPEEELVPYKGKIEHIFFHPLIAYPERAFDHDSLSKGYNDWFITVQEFNKILDSLYEKHFILVSLTDTAALAAKQQLQLPKGKKPLVLSVDDMNYYDYMLENGNVQRLVLDEKGETASLSANAKGEKVIRRDNEIVPLLDDFVRNHPDFSFRGAKGTIALTGYQGVLGYRTNEPERASYEQDKNEAIRVIDRLKATGWTFASHGYGHLDAPKVSYDRFVKDTQRWKKEVEPLVGPTEVYIYPFGSALQPKDPKFRFLLDSGFHLLCGIGPTAYLDVNPDYTLMDRRHIDGIALHEQRSRYLDLFDSKEIIDGARPSEY